MIDELYLEVNMKLYDQQQMDLLGSENYDDLKDAYYKWMDSAMQTDNSGKENKWTQSIAVGSKTFIEKVKQALGFKAKGRKIFYAEDTFQLREVLAPYGKANSLDSGNTFLWDQPIDRLRIYRPLPSLISQFLHEN